ncbi:MAG TPA: hypothetical protein VMV04_06705, partial [Thermodesulfobacteriota bacterium]|nr:hypothetical protein [Thermodesulfobacteriota bacterium]
MALLKERKLKDDGSDSASYVSREMRKNKEEYHDPRDFAFRCWKGDENSDEAEVLSGYQGRKGVKSYDGAFSWWPFEVGIE